MDAVSSDELLVTARLCRLLVSLIIPAEVTVGSKLELGIDAARALLK